MYHPSIVHRLILILIYATVVGLFLYACTTGPNTEPPSPVLSENFNEQKYPITPVRQINTPQSMEPAPTKILPTHPPTPTQHIITQSKNLPIPKPTVTKIPLEPKKRPASLANEEKGGTLNLASHIPYDSLDPHKEPSLAFSSWGPGVAYNRLLRFQAGDGVALPSRSIECDLCSKWVMKDDQTFIFHIKDGVRWHTNTKYEDLGTVDAYDVKASLERQRLKELPNSHILHMIKDIRVVTQSILEISLINADADFLSAIADGRSKVISAAVLRGNTPLDDGPVIGSGPWSLSKYTHQTLSVMINNNQNTDNPDHQALLESLRFHTIPDSETRHAAYKVGLLDIHQLSLSNRNLLNDVYNPGNLLLYPESGVGLEISFNTTNVPFDNQKVRRAAMASLNPDAIIQNAWKGQAFFSSGFPVYAANWMQDRDSWLPYFDNVDSALNSLKTTELGLPINLTIKSSDFGEEYVESVKIIKEQLSQGGFKPIINFLSRKEYAEDAWIAGNYQMMVGPPMPQTSPNGYLLGVLHSKGGWNTNGHENDALDRLLEQQAIEYDVENRRHLIKQIQTSILENGYRFMPATKISLWTWQSNIRNFNPNFSRGEYGFWEKVWRDR